jgi:hypothetical protein
MAQPRRVILYELNEVPWAVIDSYVASRPHSNLASILTKSQSFTTMIDDPTPLQPWRTWPTVHTSQLATDHKSFDLAQDPKTFHGATLWDVAEAAGLGVGLFGVMQSWPARKPKNGGFWVPDSFANDAGCYPETINRFQHFNLSATKENHFSPNADFRPSDLARVAANLLRLGIQPSSAYRLAQGLLREAHEGRHKAGRPIMQVLPCFDIYWRLQRRYRPELSIFFTNHVAAMMHRYWGDGMAGYQDVTPDYTPDPIFATLITAAMDAADEQFGRIRRYVDRHPQTGLVIASSMGQGPIAASMTDVQLVLSEPERLFRALRLGTVGHGSAMYPRQSLLLPDESSVEGVTEALASLHSAGGRSVFTAFRATGRSLQFEFLLDPEVLTGDESLTFTPIGGSESKAPLAELGIALRQRLGGANTGHHIPEGIALLYGSGVATDPGRTLVDVLDLTPSILVNLLGIDPAPTMKGHPSLFADGTVAPAPLAS